MPASRTVLAAATVCAAATICAPATAHADKADCAPSLERAYTSKYNTVRDRHGTRAPGRNIRKYGVVRRNQTIRPARCAELRKSLQQLRQLLVVPKYHPLVVTAAAPPAQMPSGVETPTVAPGGTLSAIAQCESGGNPSAVSPDGQYRGLLQFDYATWQSVGGTGDPAAASPAEQYKRGAILYARSGSAPWPVCGH
jgi:hypothetical protein